MLVRSLQGYLRSLRQRLEATGCAPKVLQDLDNTCNALNHFAELDVGQLAELLEVTNEYRRTGVIPDLNDPFRPLVRAMANSQTTPDDFETLLTGLNAKKVTPQQLRE